MSEQSGMHPLSNVANAAALPGYSVKMLGTWLTRFFNSENSGVLIVDHRQRIVILNHAAGRIFGYGHHALLDRPLEALLPARVRTTYAAEMTRFAAIKVPGRRLRIKLDLQGQRADGQEIYVGTSLSRLTFNEDVFLCAIVKELAPHQSPETLPFAKSLLAGSSQQVNEIEKRHFSRALYDDVGQSLSVLKLDLDWCERQPAHPVLLERLAQMQSLLDDVIYNTKNIASSLRPPLLDDFGLVAATQWLSERFRKRTGIACGLKCRKGDLSTSSMIESAIFRIIQEALMNIEQHARATNVDITLWRSDHQLHVVVEDDGVGLHQSWKQKPGCLGLMAMQERIALLGGTMRLKNLDPRGVALLASLPAARTRPRAAAS